MRGVWRVSLLEMVAANSVDKRSGQNTNVSVRMFVYMFVRELGRVSDTCWRSLRGRIDGWMARSGDIRLPAVSNTGRQEARQNAVVVICIVLLLCRAVQS